MNIAWLPLEFKEDCKAQVGTPISLWIVQNIQRNKKDKGSESWGQSNAFSWTILLSEYAHSVHISSYLLSCLSSAANWFIWGGASDLPNVYCWMPSDHSYDPGEILYCLNSMESVCVANNLLTIFCCILGFDIAEFCNQDEDFGLLLVAVIWWQPWRFNAYME